MEDIFQLISVITGISAGVSSIIIYFFKKYIDSTYQVKLEKFKLELEQSYKAKYLIFQSLHEQRAEAIKILFKNLTNFRGHYRGWILAIKNDLEIEVINEYYLQLLNKQFELVTFYEENAILFPDDLLQVFDAFLEKVQKINDQASLKLNRENTMELLNELNIPDKETKMHELMKVIDEDMDPIILKIADEFKKMIGVYRKDTTSTDIS